MASIRILFEDENLLALDKPSGMPSVPHSVDETGTAVQAALAWRPALHGIGAKPLEPGLLHRLDTGTSGVLLFAKSQAEFERVKAIWKSPGGVRKFYRALCPSSVQPKPQIIDYPLAHSEHSKKKMIALTSPKIRGFRGKKLEAWTEILKVEKTSGKDIYDLQIEIKTGVMHQIRCHLSAIGLPIWGDPIYGKKAERLFLHAWRLEVPLSGGARIQIESPLPKEWPLWCGEATP